MIKVSLDDQANEWKNEWMNLWKNESIWTGESMNKKTCCKIKCKIKMFYFYEIFNIERKFFIFF